MKGIPLVKILEEDPRKVVYVKYEGRGTREFEVKSINSGWPLGNQKFQTKKFDWIAIAYKNRPYLLGYGDYDWLVLSSEVTGETEGKLLRQYSNTLYSNEKLEAVGVALTPNLLNLWTKRLRAFLPQHVFVKNTKEELLTMAGFLNAEYEYASIKPSELFLCMNIIPVVRLPQDTLIEVNGRHDDTKRIWLPTFPSH